MENEKALLDIILSHLEVTTRLLDSYTKVYNALRQQPQIAAMLPAFQQPPTLRDMHASTLQLQERVRAILQKK